MLVLKDNNTIKAQSSVAPITPLSVVVTYNDTGVINVDKGVVTDAKTLGDALVEIIGAPVERINRDIRQISIINTDSQTQIVSVYFTNGGTNYNVFISELLVNEKLEFTQDDGWIVYDAKGLIKIATIKSRVHNVSNPGAALTDIYTVPTNKKARVNIVVANRANVNKEFRIAISPLGAAISNSHYTHYDRVLNGNDTHEDGIYYELQATDVIRVYASDTNTSFTVNGYEY